MNKEYIKQKSQLLFRVIQILSVYQHKKLEEIQQQSNICSDCESDEIIYVHGYDGTNIHSFGDSDDFFQGTSMIRWTGYCNKCGNEMPFYTQYEYHVGSHFTRKKGDFFMDENGNFGHA